ncbi:nitrate- and nitrite sensing domain-containing protein [Streptomyces gamaensis]|uniref:histidine kinase n=1 Tax=Streptomyces gamaensis TaxID=1763542 RepID=A0ABW0Z2X3_9ACTN
MNWLRRRRLGTTMALVLALPVALAVALAVLQLRDARAAHAAQVTDSERAVLGVAAAALARDLRNERDALALAGGKVTDDVNKRRAATDTALNAYREAAARSAADRPLADRLARAGAAVERLPQVRGSDMGKRAGLLPATDAYTSVVAALDALLPDGGPGAGRAAQAISAGASALSAQRSLLNSPLGQGTLTADEKTFLAEQEGVRRFMAEELGRSDPGSAVDDSCLSGPLTQALGGKRPPAADWVTCSSRVLDRMHEVQSTLLERDLTDRTRAEDATRQSMVNRSVAAAAALLVSAVLAALAVRRLVRRLHRLRRSALKAQNELPLLTQRMARAHDPARVTLDVTPVGPAYGDEVGEVARAFDAVVREAVRQTSQQAVLRAAVHTKLASLSRRRHVLVGLQLELLSSLQMAEQNPAVLEALFRLDHLATQMRRHDETVLALAGEDPARSHREDAPLVDVLRAAAAEVEDYTRVAVEPAYQAVYVRAHAVHGVTHMMAELIENALRFSPWDRSVRVAVEYAQDGGAVVRVMDQGEGIPADRLDALNVALQSELPVDWVQSDRTGLYVVNCLASLHGARVCLDSTERGTTVVVSLPAELVVTEPFTEQPFMEQAL